MKALVQELKLGSNHLLTHIDPRIRDLLHVLLGSVFISLLARVSIPLWFTPVPISGQTLAIMLVGVTSGSRLGFYTVACYVLQGAVGLPVFAGGAGGAHCLWGPTGGYIFAWLLQVYLVGRVKENFERFGLYSSFMALFLISLAQCFLGAMWLGLFVTYKKCLICGFYPFIAGDIAKCLITMSYLTLKRKIKENKNDKKTIHTSES